MTHRSHSASTDGYGNEIPDETAVDTVCCLQQRSRGEPAGEGETSREVDALFLPAGTVVTTGDRVVIGGLSYELTGRPDTIVNPRTGGESHIEATVVRVAGAEQPV